MSRQATNSSDAATECPGVGSGGRQNSRVGEKLLEETFDSAALALLTPDLATERQAAVALGRLRWRNQKLDDLVHRRAQTEAATSLLTPPDLCGDLKEWAASGYIALPPGTRRFLDRYEATEGDGDFREQIQRMLKPYEGPRERLLVRHLERLRKRAGHLLFAALNPLLDKAAAELGFPGAAGEPTRVLIQPPPSVVQEGGKRLEEFEPRALGRRPVRMPRLPPDRRRRQPRPRARPHARRVEAAGGAAIARTLIRPTAPMPSFRNLPKKKFDALVEFLSLLH